MIKFVDDTIVYFDQYFAIEKLKLKF
jgi:hypothetical protein